MIILSGVLLLIMVALPQMNSAKMKVKRFLNWILAMLPRLMIHQKSEHLKTPLKIPLTNSRGYFYWFL